MGVGYENTAIELIPKSPSFYKFSLDFMENLLKSNKLSPFSSTNQSIILTLINNSLLTLLFTWFLIYLLFDSITPITNIISLVALWQLHNQWVVHASVVDSVQVENVPGDNDPVDSVPGDGGSVDSVQVDNGVVDSALRGDESLAAQDAGVNDCGVVDRDTADTEDTLDVGSLGHRDNDGHTSLRYPDRFGKEIAVESTFC